MSAAAAESKRAKDHLARARKDGYDSIAHRTLMDVWYRETMNSLGYNLTDMRKCEVEGNPELRQNKFTP